MKLKDARIHSTLQDDPYWRVFVFCHFELTTVTLQLATVSTDTVGTLTVAS